MKQTIFETRQRAEELIHEAINIWRQSDMNDSLEGLEKDPVFSLLMTALAYQMNELVTDMEAMKIEVLQEFAQLLTPYEVGHAVPATAVVEAALQTFRCQIGWPSLEGVLGIQIAHQRSVALLFCRDELQLSGFEGNNQGTAGAAYQTLGLFRVAFV